MINSSRDVDAYLLGNVSKGILPLSFTADILASYGPAEAVQKFVVRLFTRKGSISTDTEKGTTLLQMLKSGRVRTEADAVMIFNSAAHDAILSLSAGLDGTEPSDEIPVDVKATSVSLMPDAVVISASMRVSSGALLSFSLPIGK